MQPDISYDRGEDQIAPSTDTQVVSTPVLDQSAADFRDQKINEAIRITAIDANSGIQRSSRTAYGASMPHPDYGALASFQESVRAGWLISPTGLGYRAGAELLMDAVSPKDDFSAQKFKDEGFDRYHFEYVPGMTRWRAELMRDYAISDANSEQYSSQKYFKTNLFGGFAGQIADLTNWGPFLFSKLGTVAGSVGEAGRVLASASTPVSSILDIESTIHTAGTLAALRTGATIGDGVVQATVQLMATNALADFTQTEYTVTQGLTDAIAAPFMISAMGGIHGAARYLNPDFKATVGHLVATAAAEGRDPTAALRSVAGTNKIIQEHATQVLDRAGRVEAGNLLTPEDLKNLQDSNFINGTHGRVPDIGDPFELQAKFESDAAARVKSATDALGELQKDPNSPKELLDSAQKELSNAAESEAAILELRKNLEDPGAAMGRTDLTHTPALEDKGSNVKIRRAMDAARYRQQADILARNEAIRLRRSVILKNSKTVSELRAIGKLTDDESWLADLYKKAFGVEVKFFDEATSIQANAFGFFHGSSDNTIHVRSGALVGGVGSMMGIAGHEVSHAIGKTLPRVWLSMVDAMLESGINPVVREAYIRTKTALEPKPKLGGNPNSLWDAMPLAARADEVFATVSGTIMQTQGFWEALYRKDPSAATALKAELKIRQKAVLSVPTTSETVKELITTLGHILAIGDNVGKNVTPEALPYQGQYARYSDRHIDFLNQVQRDITKNEYYSIFGRDMIETGPTGARRPMTLVEFDQHLDYLIHVTEEGMGELDPSADPVRSFALNDRSGTPVKAGQYDLPERKFTPMPAQFDANGKLRKRELASFVLNVIFREQPEGSVGKNLYDDWLRNDKGGFLKNHEAINKPWAPPIDLTYYKDGSVGVRVRVNDNHPMVVISRETDRALSDGLEGKITANFHEQIDLSREFLAKSLVELKTGEQFTGMDDPAFADALSSHDSLLREFFSEPAGHKTRASKFYDTANDVIREWSRVSSRGNESLLDALIHSYDEFVQRKLSEIKADNPEFQNLMDRTQEVDVLKRALEEANIPSEEVILLQKKNPEKSLNEVILLQKKNLEKSLNKAWRDKSWQELSNTDHAREKTGLVREPNTDPKALLDQVNSMRKKLAEDEWRDLNAVMIALHGREWKPNTGFWSPEIKAAIAARVELKLLDCVPGMSYMKDGAKLMDQKFISYDEATTFVSKHDELSRHMIDSQDSANLENANSGVIDIGAIMDESINDPGAGMARLAGEGPDAAVRRNLDKVQRLEVSRLNEIYDMGRGLADELEREHRVFGEWNSNYEGSATKFLEREILKDGLEGFSLGKTTKELNKFFTDATTPDSEGKVKLKLSDKQRTQLSALIEFKREMDMNLERLDAKVRGTDESSAYISELFDRAMSRNNDNSELAAADVRSDIVRKSMSEMNSYIRDGRAKDRMLAIAKEGSAHLKSFLDGLAYKDATTYENSMRAYRKGKGPKPEGGATAWADSVQTSKIMAREQAQARLINVIEQVNQEVPGFKEQFLSDLHTREIELHSRGLSTKPQHILAIYDRILKVLRQQNEALVGEANALGSNIRLHDNYLWSHSHQAEKIRSAGYAVWKDDLFGRLDIEQMKKLHGVDWKPEEWAQQFFHEVTDASAELLHDFDPDTAGNNLANPYGVHRSVAFKPGEAHGYNVKFGTGNTARTIVSQLGARGEKIGMMRKMGTNYERNWSALIAELGGPGPFGHDLHAADQTFRFLAGQLDHPYNISLAATGRAVRNWMNSSVAWMSGVSSLTDYGNLASELRFMGGPDAASHGQIMASMLNASKKDGAGAAWLRGNGAGIQTLVQHYTRNLDGMGAFSRLAQKASDFTFKYNGLEIMNRATQGAFFDIATQITGEMAHSKNLTPEFTHWLEIHNISAENFREMARYAAPVDGLDGIRLSPDMIPNITLSRKLHAAMRASMDYALLQPSSSTEALMRMGTRAGTWTGEAVRTIMHFKSYPVDMVRKITRRFNNGYAQSSLNERIVWGATMLGLATTALSIKDMARGTEPFNPFDSEQYTVGNFMRITSQAAVGPFATLEQFFSPAVFGPTGQNLYGLIAAKDGYGRINAAYHFVPGQTAPFALLGFRQMMSTILPVTYGKPMQDALDFYRSETGKGNLLLNNSYQK